MESNFDAPVKVQRFFAVNSLSARGAYIIHCVILYRVFQWVHNVHCLSFYLVSLSLCECFILIVVVVGRFFHGGFD